MVIPNEGKQYWLDVALGISPAEDLVVALYSNNYTPVDGSTAGDFTAATFTGSGAITLTPLDWGVAVIVANVAENETGVPPEWTHGGGAAQVVYGWFALTSISSVVAAAQRFDASRNMTPGSIESLDPFKLKLKSFA